MQLLTIKHIKQVTVQGQQMTLYSADGKSWVSNPIELASYDKRQVTAQRLIVLDENILSGDERPVFNPKPSRKRPKIQDYKTKLLADRESSRKRKQKQRRKQLEQKVWFT